MNRYAYAAALTAGILVVVCTTGIAAADTQNQTESSDESSEDDGPIIDLSPITDKIGDLIGVVEDWPKKLGEILKSVFYDPFRNLVRALVGYVYDAVTITPSVQHNSAVQQVHQQVLYVSYLLATFVFMMAGILHMTGPVLGVSFADVRMMLPRVVTALVFGAFSLPLLELVVELVNALNVAFAPTGQETTIRELLGLGSGLIIAVVVKATVLLALVVLFIIRAVYILFVAAISPLLALMWSIPRVKRYANTFIAGWFAALLFAPLDLLVFRFALALMRADSATLVNTTLNWVLGIATLTLLLLVPFQTWSASQSLVGQGVRAGRTVKKRVSSVKGQHSLRGNLNRRTGKIRSRLGFNGRQGGDSRQRDKHPRETQEGWK
jgi:hypothetical protein